LQVNDRLYRSRDDRMIAGVAAGLADQLGLDPSLVRVGWVILAIVTGGLLALAYLVMMFVVPEEPDIGADGPRGTWPSSEASPTPPRAAYAATPGAAETGPPAADDATTSDRPTETVVPPGPTATRDSWRQERATSRDARRERRRARRAERQQSNTGPILLGLILVLVGAWLLARRYLPAADFDRLWPVGLVLAGVVLVVLSIRPDRNTP
jgi:phage shock protein C